jgi:hypothetical protein
VIIPHKIDQNSSYCKITTDESFLFEITPDMNQIFIFALIFIKFGQYKMCLAGERRLVVRTLGIYAPVLGRFMTTCSYLCHNFNH